MNLFKNLLWAAAPIIFLPVIGCGEAYQFAEVDGVLLIRGEPGHKIRIQYIPDREQGTTGPISVAETDSQGRFTLELRENNGTPLGSGAVVGWHRVTLSDQQLAESATGEGVPIRLQPEYSLPGSTPLKQQVNEGKQTIKLAVP